MNQFLRANIATVAPTHSHHFELKIRAIVWSCTLLLLLLE
jgi:hypothetical protein